ncbi:MAG: beta-glucanase (GH16 family), partial [Granulosicoccus sp.]
TGIDYSQDYHVYAVKWEPGRVTWYIDDQEVSVLENNEINYEELYVKLNLAMGGNWTNFPANAGGLGRPSNERFPTQNDLNNFSNPALEIDYVRVYRGQ